MGDTVLYLFVAPSLIDAPPTFFPQKNLPQTMFPWLQCFAVDLKHRMIRKIVCDEAKCCYSEAR